MQSKPPSGSTLITPKKGVPRSSRNVERLEAFLRFIPLVLAVGAVIYIGMEVDRGEEKAIANIRSFQRTWGADVADSAEAWCAHALYQRLRHFTDDSVRSLEHLRAACHDAFGCFPLEVTDVALTTTTPSIGDGGQVVQMPCCTARCSPEACRCAHAKARAPCTCSGGVPLNLDIVHANASVTATGLQAHANVGKAPSSRPWLFQELLATGATFTVKKVFVEGDSGVALTVDTISGYMSPEQLVEDGQWLSLVARMKTLAHSEVLYHKLGDRPFGPRKDRRFMMDSVGIVPTNSNVHACRRMEWLLKHAPFAMGYMPGVEIRVHFHEEYLVAEHRARARLQVALIPTAKNGPWIE